MTYLLTVLIVASLFFGLDWLLRFRAWSRAILIVIYLAWALADSILTTRQNPGHELGSFVFSILDSLVPFALWQWLASRVMEPRKRPIQH